MTEGQDREGNETEVTCNAIPVSSSGGPQLMTPTLAECKGFTDEISPLEGARKTDPKDSSSFYVSYFAFFPPNSAMNFENEGAWSKETER